ncbi:hypothetical protein PR048_030828 [Dryococelus australis]|uniref:Uncharacterized protein n=1 Tax=Dryococelus australis TaxID=614101 RepID=A0ABQ9GA38_9NEOP|nr:hypothetical protein PR048_030828 [Dryococelus australis]
MCRPECVTDGGNGRPPRKPSKRHRLARFPHAKNSGKGGGDRTRFALVGGEQTNRSATAAPFSSFEAQKRASYKGDAVLRTQRPVTRTRVPGDAAGRRVFSGISRFPRPCIPALLNSHLSSPSPALKNSFLRAAKTFNSQRLDSTRELHGRHSAVKAPACLEVCFAPFKVQTRGCRTGDTNTRAQHLIALTRKSLNRRAGRGGGEGPPAARLKCSHGPREIKEHSPAPHFPWSKTLQFPPHHSSTTRHSSYARRCLLARAMCVCARVRAVGWEGIIHDLMGNVRSSFDAVLRMCFLLSTRPHCYSREPMSHPRTSRSKRNEKYPSKRNLLSQHLRKQELTKNCSSPREHCSVLSSRTRLLGGGGEEETKKCVLEFGNPKAGQEERFTMKLQNKGTNPFSLEVSQVHSQDYIEYFGERHGLHYPCEDGTYFLALKPRLA